MSAQLSFAAGDYVVTMLKPNMVTDAWLSWLADPFIMAELNTVPRRFSRDELSAYIVTMAAKEKAVIGIFNTATRQQLGLFEVQMDRNHLSASLNFIGDLRRKESEAAFRVALDALCNRLRQQFKVGKFTFNTPATFKSIRPILVALGWSEEGVLRNEVPAASGQGRVDVVCFGRL
ncbi:MAG: hypothetical protein LCH46_07530 [Proteobacteria bacterium]|nr:hypothetical protein [Pseudomonadota bacterium]